MRFQLVFR